jgi:hypothetical protein
MEKTMPIEFTGFIARLEPDGFGIIQFDHPIGPHSNNYGLISSSTGTTVLTGAGYRGLEAGMRVKGTAEPDEHDVAAIKTVSIVTSST